MYLIRMNEIVSSMCHILEVFVNFMAMCNGLKERFIAGECFGNFRCLCVVLLGRFLAYYGNTLLWYFVCFTGILY